MKLAHPHSHFQGQVVARGYVADLSDAATWLVEELLTEFGHIDVLVTNAAMTSAGNFESFKPMAEIDDAAWHAGIERNLTTCYLVTRHAARAHRQGVVGDWSAGQQLR